MYGSCDELRTRTRWWLLMRFGMVHRTVEVGQKVSFVLRLRKLGTARSARDQRQDFPATSLRVHPAPMLVRQLVCDSVKVDQYQFVILS